MFIRSTNGSTVTQSTNILTRQTVSFPISCISWSMEAIARAAYAQSVKVKAAVAFPDALEDLVI
jgi:hypothetical protein